MTARYFAHETAVVDPGAHVGDGTRIWHFTHIREGAHIGSGCTIGQGCYIGNVAIGNQVKIQNHVSVYDGVTLQDEVFVGPGCVFTNVRTPRATVDRSGAFETTLIKRGASLGANATIRCGVVVGEFSLIGAGAVVTRDVPNYTVVVGASAKNDGFACRCGARLAGNQCKNCGARYSLTGDVLQPL